jgi:hypothetical protein
MNHSQSLAIIELKIGAFEGPNPVTELAEAHSPCSACSHHLAGPDPESPIMGDEYAIILEKLKTYSERDT